MWIQIKMQIRYGDGDGDRGGDGDEDGGRRRERQSQRGGQSGNPRDHCLDRSAFHSYLINLNEILLCVSWALSQALEIQRLKSVVPVFHYQRIGVEVMERQKDLSFRLSQNLMELFKYEMRQPFAITKDIQAHAGSLLGVGRRLWN